MTLPPDGGSSFYRLAVADVLLVAVVIAASLSTFLWARAREARASGGPGVARVLVEDTPVEQIDLNTDGQTVLAEIGMTFEVRNGRIRVVESDCPHRICVNMGWIGRGGQIVACVPNKVIVEVETREAPFLDAVVY